MQMLGHKPLGNGLKINLPDTVVCEKRGCYGLYTNEKGYVNMRQGVNSTSTWLTEVVTNAITSQPSSGEKRVEDVIVAVEKRANWGRHTHNRLRVITAALYPATVGETCSAAHDMSGAREDLMYQTYIKPAGCTASFYRLEWRPGKDTSHKAQVGVGTHNTRARTRAHTYPPPPPTTLSCPRTHARAHTPAMDFRWAATVSATNATRSASRTVQTQRTLSRATPTSKTGCRLTSK